MDRRTLLPAVLVAALLGLCLWVLPAVSHQVGVDDPVRAGDVVQVGDQVEFVPAVGWQLESGVRQHPGVLRYPEDAVVSQRGYTFSVHTDNFQGTAAQLLDQLRKNYAREGRADVAGVTRTFTTASGESGVVTRFGNGSQVGLLAAVTFDGIGVEVVVTGMSGVSDPDTVRDIATMLATVQSVTSATQGRSAS